MLIEDNNIWAKSVLASECSNTGKEMHTLEIQIPRFILAELNTHGLLKKNTQSSRAVPIKAMLDLYQDSYYLPAGFGRNKSGMSSNEYLTGEEDEQAAELWMTAERNIRLIVERLGDKDGLNVHKQWAARLYEPFMYTKLVISATEWDNFEWLRDDLDAAQPEMVDIARKIKKAKKEAEKQILYPGMWHMPYVKSMVVDVFGAKEQAFFDANGNVLTVDEALMVSASCAAQMSYRKADDSLEKAQLVYDRLFNGNRPHYSPTEHQARVMKHEKATLLERVFPSRLEEGVSHMDSKGYLWSANLKGYVQHRKLLELHN